MASFMISARRSEYIMVIISGNSFKVVTLHIRFYRVTELKVHMRDNELWTKPAYNLDFKEMIE